MTGLTGTVRSCAVRLLAFLAYHSGLLSLVRYLGRQEAKIILYHAVSSRDPALCQDLSVPPVLFVKQMRYARRHYRIMSLEELVACLGQGTLPARSLVITFDDGFRAADCNPYGWLTRQRLPFTLFLVSDSLFFGKPLWVQELLYLFRTFGIERVLAAFRKAGEQWDPGTAGHSTSAAVERRFQDYLAYRVSKERRDGTLGRLYREFGLSREQVWRGRQAFLTVEEALALQAQGASIGNHGQSHTPFTAMSPAERSDEITTSKGLMEARFNCRFLPFAYPFGQEADVSQECREALADAGHDCVLTALPTPNTSKTSPFDLGRIPVGAMPVYRFAFELEKNTIKRLIRGRRQARERLAS